MEIPQTYIDNLESEIRSGLLAALERQPTRDDIRATLAARRQERLVENYHKLAQAEHEFFEVVDVSVNWEEVQPVLRWVETEQERRIWDYARNLVSSMPENRVIGRQMRYYFADAISGRWLGIVCLASALTLLTPRHQKLKWDGKTRFRNLCKIMNIAVCVPVQPFGTLCGGKLLFVSSLSNEVIARYKDAYGDDLLAIETTSLYGRSSQYNRVREFEYLGKTKGSGNIHVSDALWNKIIQLIKAKPEFDIAGSSSIKMRRLNDISSFLGIKTDTAKGNEHNHRRGYYWGVTAENSENILTERTTDPPKFIDRPLADLTAFWRKRWYEMRLPKKMDEALAFDVREAYSLDNNVPESTRQPRQIRMFG